MLDHRLGNSTLAQTWLARLPPFPDYRSDSIHPEIEVIHREAQRLFFSDRDFLTGNL